MPSSKSSRTLPTSSQTVGLIPTQPQLIQFQAQPSTNPYLLTSSHNDGVTYLPTVAQAGRVRAPFTASHAQPTLSTLSAARATMAHQTLNSSRTPSTLPQPNIFLPQAPPHFPIHPIHHPVIAAHQQPLIRQPTSTNSRNPSSTQQEYEDLSD